MNLIESLPKCIRYKNEDYYLRVHVNAWNNLTIGYFTVSTKPNEVKSILSYCIERTKEPYIPTGFDAQEGGLNENIGNDRTLDDCIDHIFDVIEDENNKNLFELQY